MNLTKFTPAVLFFTALFLVSSCVSQKKYDELMTEKTNLEMEVAECEDELSITQNKKENLEKQVEQLKQDTTRLGEVQRRTQAVLDQLNKDYDELEQYYNNLLANSGKLNRELAQQQKRVLAMESDLEAAKERNDALAEDLKEREKRLEELEKILADKEKAVNELRQRVQNALLNFKESDLTVEIKNGKVYVSLAEQLLFGSGSVTVDEKGKAALKQLADVLKEQEDIQIMVEGHTDNVPVSRISQYMNDNWDLSVMRATSIIRILRDRGLQEDKLIAAGRGEFLPLVENADADGRRKNRRTEIIITPRLDDLFQILEVN
ncbi:MAG: OmpA family protein [Cyclobacteriaceae bacterium]|nr:OmpA family protein [Cyclobacteriaceae bacterium]MCH8515478.1 OmpA family protein [Cyclobacteriaceae bacterium]